MKNMVVYSSLTGNTKAVAEAIQVAMPEGCEIYAVEKAPSSETYELVAVGFWVDRGTADANAKKYLSTLANKKIILWDFGEGRPTVNPAYLLDILTAFPDASITCGAITAPLYFSHADGEAILLPVRPNY